MAKYDRAILGFVVACATACEFGQNIGVTGARSDADAGSSDAAAPADAATPSDAVVAPDGSAPPSDAAPPGSDASTPPTVRWVVMGVSAWSPNRPEPATALGVSFADRVPAAGSRGTPAAVVGGCSAYRLPLPSGDTSVTPIDLGPGVVSAQIGDAAPIDLVYTAGVYQTTIPVALPPGTRVRFTTRATPQLAALSEEVRVPSIAFTSPAVRSAVNPGTYAYTPGADLVADWTPNADTDGAIAFEMRPDGLRMGGLVACPAAPSAGTVTMPWSLVQQFGITPNPDPHTVSIALTQMQLSDVARGNVTVHLYANSTDLVWLEPAAR